MHNKFILAILFVLFAVVCTMHLYANDDKASKVNGVWLTGSGKARVKVVLNEKTGKYEGRIVWLREPNDEAGNPKVDKNNPEEGLKKRPLLGLKIIRDFDYKGNGLWENGKIYDPENGNDYSCTITLTNDNTLEVRGFIGVSVFGRTDVWTRQVKKD
jgi:uncharacterized protein (DUF2147 family)